MQAESIDEVIQQLDEILAWTKGCNSRLGYFAALYRKVTCNVKQGIVDGFFEDGARMEHFDVMFANRYLDAFRAYRNGTSVARSWKVAFEASDDWWALVLQHLLLGMNAHINLDLGIAAAQACPGAGIHALENDFNKINQILGGLIDSIESALSTVWPMLRLLDWAGGRTDETLIHFSIDEARSCAWNVATDFATCEKSTIPERITLLDYNINRLGHKILHPGPWLGSVTNIIRLGEHGNIADTIVLLERI